MSRKMATQNVPKGAIALSDDRAQINSVIDGTLKRLGSVDKMIGIIEATLESTDDFGSPLTLAPGSVGYEDVIELFTKLVKSQKDLAETYRKLKTMEIDLRSKEQKLILADKFAQFLKGKTTEQIRQLIHGGECIPINQLVGSVFADGIVNNSINSSKAIMQNMGSWNQEESVGTNEAPVLQVHLNLSDKVRSEVNAKMEATSDVIDCEYKEV